MTMAMSESYKRHANGNDCALLGDLPKTPCWGQVKSVDSNDNGEGKDARTWHIYACEGHKNKVLRGYREAYIKEGKSDGVD